jgi:hypothetical protein
MATAGKARRTQISVIVSPELKTDIERLAKEQGRSQGQIVELMLERARDYDALLAGLNTTLQQIRQGNLESALREAGYTSVHSSYGKVWLPPGYPLLHGRSGFIAPEKGEQPGPSVEVPPLEPLSGDEIARNVRDIRERMARLEVLIGKGSSK